MKEIKNLQSKEIQLPTPGLIMQRGEVLHETIVEPKGLKLVVYTNSIGCTTCAITHIDSWDWLIEYTKQYRDQSQIPFTFSPMKRELPSIELMLTNYEV